MSTGCCALPPCAGSSAAVCGAGRSQRFLEQPTHRPHTGGMGAKSRGSILGGGAPPTDGEDTPADGASLPHPLFIAMPSLWDPNFSQTVALICEHTEKGALGMVLNKPLPMKLSDVLSQMKLEPSSDLIAELPVLRGGPVNTDRGFVLHRP